MSEEGPVAARTAISRTLAVIGLLTVSFLGYDYYGRRLSDARLEEERKKTELERQRAEQYKAQLQSVLAENKTTRFRVLRIEKAAPEAKAGWRYALRISQWNDKSEKIFSRDVEIIGNKIYFEGVVIHFQPEQISQGKGNVHLLTRVFSDTVPPSKGVSLIDDQIEAANQIVQSEAPLLDPDKRLSVLRYLRRIASDPQYAKAEGVRTINGEAVCDYQDLSEAYVYTLVAKANGGFLIEKAPIP
jgi:hypothetical protein